MNRPVHFEIPADDPERAAQFYQSVFGWKVEKWEGGNESYWLISTGPKEQPGIDGGLMKREKPVSGEGVRAYVCTMDVENVDEIAEKIRAAGGQTITEKMEVPKVGWMYYCLDTEGNQFGIMQMMPEAMQM